jgi:hypothetical protein
MVDKVYLFNKQLFIVYFYVGDFVWDLLFTLLIDKVGTLSLRRGRFGANLSPTLRSISCKRGSRVEPDPCLDDPRLPGGRTSPYAGRCPPPCPGGCPSSRQDARALLSTSGRTPLPPRHAPAAALQLAPAAHPAKPPSTALNFHTPQGDKNAEYVWRFSLFWCLNRCYGAD